MVILDAIPTALFADVYVATAALQNILVMTGIAHLAPEASTRFVPVDALKAPRMLALVVFLQFRENLAEALQPLLGEYVCWHISLHNFFCAFFDAIDIGWRAITVFPIHTTYVAELRATDASLQN